MIQVDLGELDSNPAAFRFYLVKFDEAGNILELTPLEEGYVHSGYIESGIEGEKDSGHQHRPAPQN